MYKHASTISPLDFFFDISIEAEFSSCVHAGSLAHVKRSGKVPMKMDPWVVSL